MVIPTISISLDIPEVRVLGTELTSTGEYVITIESMRSSVACAHCGQRLAKVHALDEWVSVRHLAILGHPSYLRYRPRRFRCPDCPGQPTTTEQFSWHSPHSPNTLAYENHVLVQLTQATVEDVSQKEDLAYDRVLGILERRIEATVAWQAFTALEVLGLDEIALKKGHRDFVVIVTARLASGALAILAVLPNREKATLLGFLQSIPLPLRGTLHSVCCDLFPGYAQAVREALPAVKIVADRFHVAQHYRAAADTVRKSELRRLKQELPKADYAPLQGVFWAFRKNAADLDPTEHALLERAFILSPRLHQAYRLREDLTQVFEQPLSKAQAQAQLRTWREQVRQSGLICFDEFLHLLETWEDEITNYFEQRLTSGFVEGFNNKLKVLKRRCYGLLNLPNLFRRIYLDLNGYRLFA